ncbi:phage tail protein, partial [Methylorubrum sp. POS3]|uniref:TipJ family phage tail tip protein n=2 Tax=Methylorubrum sp. POS3 TaxID=2998492 RepID=UPI00372A7E60
LIDLLGEGEIVGVRGGLKGVYLNDVPVENADGSSNFKGLSAEFRVGAPDQTYMPGYADVQTPREVGIRVTQATPVVVSITDTDVDRVRVTVQIPSLFLAKADGPVRANTLTYRIEARYSGGPWVDALGDLTLTGKTTSGYFRSHEIPLPRNPAGASAPWQVRVVRVSPDTDAFNASQSKVTSQSDLVFASTTSIVDAKFSYPHSAVVGLTAQASAFGTSVPARTYLVAGVRMPIPSNYDPATRTYTGIWDGTFGEGFTDNPAWALHLILRDDRFGLGAFIDTAAIDKWALYEIARYCDALVPDGRGGLEPRHTFNGVIATQQEAFELLQLIAQIFRGTVFWSSGTVTASQDRPGDPILLVTEANVLDGTFSYASTGRRARHTVALVAWNDPDNLYKPAIEVVEDAEGVARYGYNPTRIDLLGCTSRGQAHRAGRWLLFTELHQTQIVSYRAGLDHAVARPGDLVAIQDPQIANLDLSGRLLAGSSLTRLVLDRPVTLAAGASYAISVTLPDGTVEERAIETGAGTVTTVALAAALTQVPDPAAVWLIAGPVEPQLYRIVSIREEEPHVYAVSALQHEPGKYDAIDRGAAFEPSTITAFPAVVAPPRDLTVRESQYSERGQAKQALTLSWTAGQPFNAVAHTVTAIRPSGAVVTSRTPSTSIDFTDAETGEWKFTVVTTGLNGNASIATEKAYTVIGWAGQAPATVTGLSVKGGGHTFSGRSCSLTWANKLADGVSPYPIRNVVYVYDAFTAKLLHREMLPVGQTEWSYDYNVNVNEGGPRRQFRVSVCALSAEDGEGPPASLLVSNPPPGIIVPTLNANSETIFVELPKVADLDFEGYLVWVSETPNINPATAQSYEVRNGVFTFAGTPNKTYYVRAAAYDAFSKNPAELNVSAEVAKTVSIELFDTSAPARPGQPTLASSAETGLDGSLSASVRATWAAVTSANLSHYEVAWQIGSGDWETRKVETHAATMRGFRPASAVNAKVRSVSKAGVPSDYGPVGSVTTAKSTLAPGNPTNPSVSGRFQRVVITFAPPADRDLDYIEVWGFDGVSSAATPPSGSTLVGRVPYGQAAYWDDMPTTGQRTYWLRARNTSDLVASSYLWAGTAQTAALDGAQIAAGTVDATRMAAGLEVPRVVTSLPTTKTGQFVTLQSDGKLYRWDAALAKYVPASLQVSEIAGLTGNQIANRTIAAGHVVANALTGNEIQANSVNADRLVASSITAAQIRAGAVGADQIAAGAITASKLAINGANMAFNPDMAQGTRGWHKWHGWNSDPAAYSPVYVDPVWCPAGFKAAAIAYYKLASQATHHWFGLQQTRLSANGDRADYPIVGGTTYEFSAYVQAHRCIGRIYVDFLNASHQYVGTRFVELATGGQAGWSEQDHPRITLIAKAPADATYCQVFFMAGQISGDWPYLFVTGFMMAATRDGATETSPYQPPSATLIDGGNLFTNSLHADRIAAGTITTDRLQAGAIHVDTIAANGSISAAKLAVDVLTANAITVSGGTKLSSWATGTQINGGAIKADSIDASRLAIGSRAIQIAGLDFECVRDGNG